jgi:transcriptional regulator with XRE-family HTH domain
MGDQFADRGAPKGSVSKAPIDVHIGIKIRARRQELGLSQTALGKEVGVSFQQIQKYENGSNRIGASRLALLAKVLQVPIDYFFPRDDGEPASIEDVAIQIANLTRRIRFLTEERDRLRQLL